MNKIKNYLISLCVLFLVTACGIYPAPTNVESGNAVVVLNVVEGIEEKKVESVSTHLKTGKACTSNLLYLVNTGDSSITKAKEDGHITKVHYIERTKSGVGIWAIIPFIYSNVCTVVYGE